MILTGKYTDKIGEIIEYDSILNKYKVNISNNDIAGFNNDFIYDTEWFTPNDFILLDEGLNSPYLINIDSILGLILSIEE
jgi:hypothetical protein